MGQVNWVFFIGTGCPGTTSRLILGCTGSRQGVRLSGVLNRFSFCMIVIHHKSCLMSRYLYFSCQTMNGAFGEEIERTKFFKMGIMKPLKSKLNLMPYLVFDWILGLVSHF